MNTYKKHWELVDTAKSLIIDGGGIKELDGASNKDRRVALVDLAESVCDICGTTQRYARPAVAKACRLLRGDVVKKETVAFSLRLPVDLNETIRLEAAKKNISIHARIIEILENCY